MRRWATFTRSLMPPESPPQKLLPMNAFLPIRQPPTTSPGPAVAASSLKVVIVYDDFAAGDRAMRVLMQLKNQLRPGFAFSPTPWSFDFLAELPWRTQALCDVNSADLVVISISQPEDIPAAINHWIKSCLNRIRSKPVEMIVLLDSDEVWTLSLDGAVATASQPDEATADPARAPAWPTRDYSSFPFTTRLLRPTAFPG